MTSLVPSGSRLTILIALGAAGLGLVAARRASACSPPEPGPGYAAFGAFAPADGATNVPIDTAVVLDLEIPGPGERGTFTIDVTDAETGEAVPGSFAEYYWGNSLMAWRPAGPLQPNRRYQVSATAASGIPRPAGARGTEQVSFSFTTGTEASPPIIDSQRLAATLEPEVRDDYSTCSPGLCTCTPTAQERGMRARLTLPSFFGGQPYRGYRILVMVTADRPYDFTASPTSAHVYANGAAYVPEGDVGELVVGSIDGTGPYRPCFAVQGMDVSGRFHVAEPICLTDTVAVEQKLGANAGCSVAPANTAQPIWLAPAAALLGGGLLLRRRRR